MSKDAGFQLRTFIFIDQMQPQLAQFIAKDNRVYDPKEYDAAIMLELAPAMEIHRMIYMALKSTNVRLGSVVTERQYGLMQIQHEDQGALALIESCSQMLVAAPPVAQEVLGHRAGVARPHAGGVGGGEIRVLQRHVANRHPFITG